MKRIWKLLLVIASMFVFWMHTMAPAYINYDFNVDGIYYAIIDKSTVMVCVPSHPIPDYKYWAKGNITIPERVTYEKNTYTVVGIGSEAFYECVELESVQIPNTVTRIGPGAFYGCTGLTYMALPKSLTTVEATAFSGCTRLSGVITIPESLTEIGKNVFSGCVALEGVKFHNYLTRIGDNAFYGCTKLKGLEFPSSLTEIGEYSFCGCSGLTGMLSIPESVTNIGQFAFSECRGISQLSLPGNMTTINEYVFVYCENLKSVDLTSVTTICRGAFSSCKRLTDVRLSDSLQTIGRAAFADCENLTSVTIPNSLTAIELYAFSGCGLRGVIIPPSVREIQLGAFACDSLAHVITQNTTPPTIDKAAFSNYNATLYVPADKYAVYAIDENWSQFNNIKKFEVAATGLSLNETAVSMPKTATKQIMAIFTPENVTIRAGLWESSNTAVATINSSGYIKAVAPGKTVITVKTIDGSNLSAQCEVTVTDIKTVVTLSQSTATLAVNDIMTLRGSVYPSNVGVKWSSSNTVVADFKVNADNSITIGGLADGVATITATATDGSGASASCVVTVGTGGIDGVEADNAAIEVGRYDLYGRRLSQPAQGVNIVKMSDGTIRKEVVK